MLLVQGLFVYLDTMQYVDNQAVVWCICLSCYFFGVLQAFNGCAICLCLLPTGNVFFACE
ncbi:MAG: hypothetical protein D8H98_00145 [Prevotella sp.]|nr:MAG: hypothetical protein D8H98_00145 [Prevotella sp.]